MAAVYAADRFAPRALARVGLRTGSNTPAVRRVGTRSPHSLGRAPLFLDYRLVIAGSMLSDVIDKPLGLWLAPGLVNHTTQSFGHSLAFIVLLTALCWAALRFGLGRSRLLGATVVAGHLALDGMWRKPATLLWPALGWSFPADAATLSEWSQSHWRGTLMLYRDPAEVAGAAVMLLFAVGLSRPGAFGRFVRSGEVVERI